MKGIIFLLSFFLCGSLFAKPIILKIALMAPEDTSWAKNLKSLATDISEATKKRVELKIYYGGSQGDEPDILRKIHINQLQGGIFTGKTLGEINGDVRVMEIPYTFFSDRDKAIKTLNAMTPYFNKKLEERKMKNLGFFELGMVYFVSKKKIESLDSLQGLKIWTWQGDELVASVIRNMKLVSVPLPLTDVLSSLSTGIVEAAYAPPLGVLALQWNSKVKYLIDFPLAFSLGAILVSKAAWSKITPEDQKIIEKLSNDNAAKLNAVNDKDNQEALAAMKDTGITFIKFPEKDISSAKAYRTDVVKQLTGKLFSKEAYDKMEGILKE
jgi:TRAP-type C4-dicarboxylate transport system substrate-binding protein